MAVIFYLLGWIGILYGVGTAGWLLFQAIQGIIQQTTSNSLMSTLVTYMSRDGLALASPGLAMAFSGLLLLAVGGILSRLSEIAYNTRNG